MKNKIKNWLNSILGKTQKERYINIIGTWAVVIISIIGLFAILLSPVNINGEVDCTSGEIDLNLSFEDLNKTTIQNIKGLGCKLRFAGESNFIMDLMKVSILGEVFE